MAALVLRCVCALDFAVLMLAALNVSQPKSELKRKFNEQAN